jgi:uncharacterized protein involved in exopolysaccharide biosynthesis
MDEELSIDLRHYLDLLLRRRRLILAITALALTVAAGVSLISPPPYEAVAGVAIIKFPIPYEVIAGAEAVRANVQLQPGPSSSFSGLAPEAQRQALQGLVSNAAVAQAVIRRMGERLRPEDRELPRLLAKVKGEVLKQGTTQGDLILIKVRDPDPIYAADLANAWAAEYERYVNELYGGGTVGASEAARAERERAWKEYEAAQRDLEAYLAENPLDELRQRMDQLERIVGALHQQRLEALATAIQERLSTRLALMKQYLGAYNTTMTTPLSQELDRQVKLLAQLYAARIENERILEEARSLRAQVGRGGDPSARSNSLALVLLKAQAFASSGGLPSSLQLVLGGVGDLQQGAFGQMVDLDALIAVLEERGKRLDEEIARQTQTLQSGVWASTPALNMQGHPLQRQARQQLDALFRLEDLPDLIPSADETPLARLIAQYTAEMDRVRSEIEQAEARKRELIQRRDLAWDSYTTLSRKAAEVGIAATVTGSTVRFALPASPPLQRTSSRALILALAGMLGLFGAVVVAFAIEGLGIPEPRPVLWGPAGAPWNRIWRWAFSPAPGLGRRLSSAEPQGKGSGEAAEDQG